MLGVKKLGAAGVPEQRGPVAGCGVQAGSDASGTDMS